MLKVFTITCDREDPDVEAYLDRFLPVFTRQCPDFTVELQPPPAGVEGIF